ncbi:MAG: CHAT domain-containing protein, partial [Bacteroidota bacterium]
MAIQIDLTPAVYLTFAADPEGNALPALQPESQELNRVFASLHQKQEIQVLRDETAVLDEILETCARYQEQMIGFHYAGHASGETLDLEDGAASSDSIAQLLGSMPNLMFACLNGCATFGQVEKLFAAGVPVVIATSYAVSDVQAKTFARKFYEALAEGKSLEASFDFATQAILAKLAKGNHHLHRGPLNLDANDEESDHQDFPTPWGIYYSSEHETVAKTWTLAQGLRSDHMLRTGSKAFYAQETAPGKRLHIKNFQELLLSSLDHPQAGQLPEPQVKHKDKILGHRQTIETLWENEMQHCLIRGAGGTGKTVALVKLWEAY